MLIIMLGNHVTPRRSSLRFVRAGRRNCLISLAHQEIAAKLNIQVSGRPAVL
jgi:hypothetical protein